MSINAIIAEYNPFHNGHLHQINSINSDYTVIIMSSSFTQRGTPAILNKFTRARLAIENGADLVLELPAVYCTSNAQIFSEGAVSILNSLGAIDNLCFGAEDTLQSIINLVDKTKTIDKNLLAINLSKGYSFIQAKQLSYPNISEEELLIMNKPNNILAIEYVKALNKFNSNIKPFSIPRKKVEHSSDLIVDGFASASTIRKLCYEEKFDKLKSLVPENTYLELKNNYINTSHEFFKIFKYKLMLGNINFSDYMDYELGLENRLYDNLDITDYDDYIDAISTKRYTKSRIRRLLIQITFDLKREFILESLYNSYIRVLAVNAKGTTILNKIKNNNINYITKFSETANLSEFTKEIIKKEILITNTYNMMSGAPLNQDFKNNPFIKM
ncbi:Predicted nucleotidyltransferase [Peptoniphilus asaccharolyticus DSM 20463]|uniref:tRNA(Met) cytidine acetate ligase n=1 Tax=Peptoniphilus asaccharolyticus DSM 20463 TaxID=573058 RepID=A0A1W1UJZ9_PEPAS|nr:nucleotidyltransferase family protein [Peptoniphilus asaccharolyticus]MBL7574841.1 nucleotidyltransferase family protein [Peptoniphilus asaccharolyticus]SMB81455.1 Predicted nucleotidyltransferase [Peptoniphilus asaccharolyticus DSM 20463]